MRHRRIKGFLGTAVFLAAAGFVLPTVGQAQIGFTAYMGGTLPTGEFGRTIVDTTRAKSGAENGHAFGGAIAWGLRFSREEWSRSRLSPAFIFTLGYSETEFGNDVPVSVFPDQEAILITPTSRIRMRSFRAGVRVIPWTSNLVAPTVGGGYERGKMKVDNWSFYGPGPEADDLSGHTFIKGKLESENISGVFLHAGVATEAKKAAIFYLDAVYHILFAEGVSTTSEFTIQGEVESEEGTIKSDFHWWEFRGGLIFFIGE